jgi:hypothetical protein
MRFARFAVLALLAIRLYASGESRPLDLVPAGAPRVLPERMLGICAEPFWDHLIDDPQKVAAIKTLHAAYTRFPGGTLSNYYDWKRGSFFLEPKQDASPYYKLFAKYSQWAAEKFPKGTSFEQYKAFSDSIGADVLLEPNLETASVEDQAAWFKHLAAEGIVPTHIELGNEFWIATGMDPGVLKRWPDSPTSMRIMRQYVDAFRPYLPKGERIAVQAAGPSFQSVPDDYPPLTKRLREWDEVLKPEPWFDAVTVHLHPRITAVLGRKDAGKDPMTPAVAERNLRALMARVDDGTDNVLRELAHRLPGKEIWVTEWNPRGGDAVTSPDETEPATPAAYLHTMTRMSMALLRHPEVTQTDFYQISFLSSTPRYTMFVMGEQGYQPLPAALALTWFNQAAGGGGTFRRYLEAGNPRIPGGGAKPETYAAVEGALFRAADRATLILQNASAEARTYRIGKDLKLKTPSLVEQMAMPDLAETANRAAKVATIRPSEDIPLPAYSVTRIVWSLSERLR